MQASNRAVLVALAVGVVAPAARAELPGVDTFDTYTTQAEFEAVWPGISATGPGLLSNAQSVTAPNSVHIPSEGAAATRRSRDTFDETGTIGVGDKIIWSFDFYDEAPTAIFRNFSNLQDSTAPSATNQLISMGINNNQTLAANGGARYMARILGYTPEDVGGASGSYFKLNDFEGTGTRSLGWHNLRVELTTDDGASTDYAFYVDDALAETVDNVGTAASIRSFDNITIGSGISSANGAYYDNMRLQFVPVPEPTAVAFGALAATGLLARRRRSHQ